MRVVIGDCAFEATGDPAWIDQVYQKWIAAVRKHWRAPIESRIAQLHAELREQRRLLKRIDGETIPSNSIKGA